MRLAALVVAVARIRWHTGCSFISRNGRHALHRLQHIHGTNGLHQLCDGRDRCVIIDGSHLYS